jgi:diguanylate cyclase
MSDSNSSKNWEIANKAFEHIKNAHIEPLPKNFDVWFQYYSRSNPDIVKAIDDYVQKGNSPNAEITEKIYNTFIGNESNARALDMVNKMLGKQINHVMTNIEDFSQDTSVMSEMMFNASVNLKNNDVIGEKLIELVAHLAETAGRSSEKAKFLEKELDNALSELNKLQHYVVASKQEDEYDALTSLYSRKRLEQIIPYILREFNESKGKLSIAIFGLDHFDEFLDNWGETTTNQMMRFIARTVKENVKGRDIPARYTHNSFALLLPETDMDNSIYVMKQISSIVERKRIVKKTTGEFLGRMTLSGGVTEYRAGESLGGFLMRAENYFLQAQETERNTFMNDKNAKPSSAYNAA